MKNLFKIVAIITTLLVLKDGSTNEYDRCFLYTLGSENDMNVSCYPLRTSLLDKFFGNNLIKISIFEIEKAIEK